jgi:hypothetical protein
MPYNPQITDQSGMLLAQGRLAGGMAALGGISQGIQTYQKNRLQNQVLSSENDSLIAGLQQLQQMGGGATMSNLAPAGMEKLIQKHLEGGGLNLSDSMKLNSMLNTTLKTAQVGQQMQAQQMQAQVAEQKLMNEIATGRQAQADVVGIGKVLQELSEQGDFSLEKLVPALSKAKISASAVDSLTQSLSRMQKPASIESLRYASQQEKEAAQARIESRANQIALKQPGSALTNKAEENAARVAAAKIYESGLVNTTTEVVNPTTGQPEFFQETRNITGELVGRKPVYAPNASPEEQALAAEKVAAAQSSVKWMDTFSENASLASTRLAKNKAAIALLESGNVKTGPGTPFIQGVRRVFAAYGGDPKAISDTANFGLVTNLLGDQVFDYFQKTKGAISDYETKYISNLSAKENKTNAENVAILKMAVAIDERTQNAKKALREAQKSGQVKNARDERRFIEDYVDNNPLDFAKLSAMTLDEIVERNLRPGRK